MKKVVLFLVVLCMTLNSFSMFALAADEISFSISDMKGIIADLGDKLDDATALDRDKSFLLAKAYISTDDGIDTLIEIAENDEFSTNPVVADIYNVLGDISTWKDQFVFMLKLMKCFTPEERVEVLDTFHSRDDIGFKTADEKVIREIFEYFNPNTTIDTLESENTVSGAMIASLFSIFEGHVMLTDTKANSSDFALKKISPDFKNNFNEMLSEYTIDATVYTAEDFIDKILDEANEEFPSNIKRDIKEIFGVVGIYEAKKESSSSSSSSSGVKVTVTPGTGTSGSSTVDKNDMTQYGTVTPGTIISPEAILDKIAEHEATTQPGTGTEAPGTGTETPGTGTETPGTGTGTGTSGFRLIGFDDCVDHWSDGVTTYLKYKSILKGDAGTNNYRPDFKINREEMSVIIMRYFELRDHVRVAHNVSTGFDDEEEMSPWAVESIAYLTKKGVLKGYPDGDFRPKQEITREEAIAIISRVLNNRYRPKTIAEDYVDHDDIGEWAVWDVNYTSSLKIAEGYSTGEFLPKNNITRAEVASLIYKMMCIEGMAR